MGTRANTRFRTISEPAESYVKERGSKFMGFAFPVNSKLQVDQHMEALKSEFPDATHHCYAFRIGHDGNEFRYSDDGEPSNSAGSPIYRQLLSYAVTNTLLVVVRYYGGKKLGVPGLIEAYGTAAQKCLEATNIIEQTLSKSYSIKTQLNKEYLIYQLAAKYKLGNPAVDQKQSNLFHFEVELDRWSEITDLLQNLKHFELIID